MFGAMALAGMLVVSKAERDAAYDKPPQNTLRDCGSDPEPYGECRLSPNLTSAQVEAKLGGKATAYWREGDEFVVVARRDTDQAFLCCAARGRMDNVAGDLWAMRLRIVDLDHATIDVSVRPGTEQPWDVYRGPLAPPALEKDANIAGNITAKIFDSKYLGAQRGVLIYTPPGFDPAKKYPVVYMSDGSSREKDPEFIEPLIRAGVLPPLILVEIWPSNSDDGRSGEYLLGWPDAYGTFLKHEQFVLKEVMPYVEANFGASTDPKERIVTGFSSGAAWAISMGLRHPDIFPNVLANSLVWTGAEKGVPDDKTVRFFLSAGTLEPRFYEETLHFADLARKAGHDVDLETTVSGHSLTIFQPMLVDGLKHFLGAAPPPQPPVPSKS